MIECENEFCIHWMEGNQCHFKAIALDARGCCTDCVLVDFQTDTLWLRRTQCLARFLREHENIK